MNFVNAKNDNLLLDLSLIIICTIPYWLINDFDSIKFKIIILYFSYLFLFFALLFFCQKYKKRKFILLFFSTLIFFGLDTKFGFWIFFENFSKFPLVKFFCSLIFSLFLIYIINCALKKKLTQTKKFFFIFLLIIFSINTSLNFSFDTRFEKIEKYEKKIETSVDNSNITKTVIIILDEMIGHRAIDEEQNYGSEAKKSYIDLFEKYNFILYESAYSIYDNSEQAISSLLNFDIDTNENNIDLYVNKRSLDNNTLWEIKRNKFFENNSSKDIISNKNHAINFCNSFVKKCFRSNAINNYGNYEITFDFNSTDYFLKEMSNQNSILLKFAFKFFEKIKVYKNYHYLTFNKAKFHSDLNNLSSIIKYEKGDIFLFHFLYPHRPFFYEINLKEKKCVFKKDKLKIKNDDINVVLQQHYKEIICTNYYLDKFLEKIFKDFKTKNTNVVILSDTGIKIGSKSKKENLKNYHSVLFASNIDNKIFKLDSSFISSQKLFNNFFNIKNNLLNEKSTKIYDGKIGQYFLIDEFTFFSK